MMANLAIEIKEWKRGRGRISPYEWDWEQKGGLCKLMADRLILLDIEPSAERFMI